MRAKGGSCYLCPECSYPRFIPTDADNKTVYSFAMPKICLTDNSKVKCSFATTASAWRARTPATPEYELACQAVVNDVLKGVGERGENKEIPWKDFWPTVAKTLPEKTVRRMMVIPAAVAGPAAAAQMPQES